MPLNPGQAIRRANRAQILRFLSRQSLSRSLLSHVTGLTPAAVSRISRELLDAGLIRESSFSPSRKSVGRRSSLLSIDPGGAFALSFTLSANRMEVAVYNAALQYVRGCQLRVQPHEKPIDVIDRLCRRARQFLTEDREIQSRLIGAGVSVATAATDSISKHGVISSEVLGWTQVAVRDWIEKTLDVPVHIEPRPISLLRAEMSKNENASTARQALINVGVGMGAAVLSPSAQHHYGSGLVGLAHVTSPDTTRCHCGRAGCLEVCATGLHVVAELYGKTVGAEYTYVELGNWLAKARQLAGEGDTRSRAAFFQAGKNMAYGVDTLFALLQPEKVFLSGSTGRQPDYIAGLEMGLQELDLPYPTDRLDIVDTTSAQAAAFSAFEHFMYTSAVVPVRQLRESVVSGKHADQKPVEEKAS